MSKLQISIAVFMLLGLSLLTRTGQNVILMTGISCVVYDQDACSYSIDHTLKDLQAGNY